MLAMHGFTCEIFMKLQYKAESICTVSIHNIYIFRCFYIRKDVTVKVKLQASHLKLSALLSKIYFQEEN